MDVVERYLVNVRAYLPRDRQEDVVAELRENIRSEVEDREEKLGRPLSEEERIAILRAHGHPLLVAGRYRADGRSLVLGREVIGPALFPFFHLSLLAVAAVTGIVLVVGSLAAASGVGEPFPVFRTAVFLLSLQAIVVVAVFAGLEAWFRRNASSWDPRRLPAKDRRPPSPLSLRLQAAFQLFFTIVFLWFWLTTPALFVGVPLALMHLAPGPAWRFLYVAVAASTLISLATPSLTLLRLEWRRYAWLVSLFATGAFIALSAAGFWGGGWVVSASATPGPATLEGVRRVNAFITLVLAIMLFLSAVTTVVGAVRGAWRELRRPVA